MGVLEGIKFVVNKGFNRIQIRSDNKLVTNRINGKKSPIRATKGLISQINHELTHYILVNYTHVFREANRCVDALAKRSLHLDHGPRVYDDCSEDLLNLFVKELFGVATRYIFPL